MSIRETLCGNAREDVQLLVKNHQLGDNLSSPRDVSFLLSASSTEKATEVCDFINANRFGVAKVDDKRDVVVVIRMPVERHIIGSVSAFMCCLGSIFGVEYHGWKCELQVGMSNARGARPHGLENSGSPLPSSALSSTGRCKQCAGPAMSGTDVCFSCR